MERVGGMVGGREVGAGCGGDEERVLRLEGGKLWMPA